MLPHDNTQHTNTHLKLVNRIPMTFVTVAVAVFVRVIHRGYRWFSSTMEGEVGPGRQDMRVREDTDTDTAEEMCEAKRRETEQQRGDAAEFRYEGSSRKCGGIS